MRARQSAVLETAQAVQQFLDAHASLVGPNVTSARRNLDDAVVQLTTMAVTQTGGNIASKGATARQKALRTVLRNNYMKPVATVAKLLLPDVPEIGALEVKTKGLASTQLVAAAYAMADAATPYASIFTEHGLPDDFITQLRNAADAVTSAVNGRQQSVATTSGAVSGLQAQETRVRNLLNLINALVTPRLGTNAAVVAQWKLAHSITGRGTTTPVPASLASPSGPAVQPPHASTPPVAGASGAAAASTSAGTAAPSAAPATQPAEAAPPAAAAATPSTSTAAPNPSAAPPSAST